jgi:hypothetical protein
MSESIGFVSVTPAELNFHLQLGQRLDFENIHYITFSSIFEEFIQRDVENLESLHYIEDFVNQSDFQIDYQNKEAVIRGLLDNTQQRQSFIYSDYRYQDRTVEDRLTHIAKTNEFWRYILSNNNIDYVFTCSGGEYDRRCGSYVAQEFDTEFYFTYSVFPSKENSRVVFEPTEMQQIVEGERSESITRSRSRQIINEFRRDSEVEFSRSVDDLPVKLGDVFSLFNSTKNELKIKFSGVQTDFGWDINEKIKSEFYDRLCYIRNNDLYLDGPPDSPFVVLALHSNQDAQITVREPRFYNNQFGLVRAISNLLPYPYTLCVKQHPVAIGQHTPGELHQLQSEQNNVKFIDPKLSPSTLFDDAAAVVTIRSTIGLEALLHGCNVVTFGDPYYANTGATISASFDEIERPLIKSVQNDGPTPAEVEDLVSYLWESSYAGDTMGRLEQWNISCLVTGIESLVE